MYRFQNKFTEGQSYIETSSELPSQISESAEYDSSRLPRTRRERKIAKAAIEAELDRQEPNLGPDERALIIKYHLRGPSGFIFVRTAEAPNILMNNTRR